MLAERVTVDARAHAEQLTPNVLAALAEAGSRSTRSDAVVVGCGPGPFTGLRVGMATAAAYGHALGIPVHGVCSLDAIGVDTATGICWWSPTPAAARCTGRATATACGSTAPRSARPPTCPAGADAVAGSPEHAALFDLPRLAPVYPSPAGLVRAVRDWDGEPAPAGAAVPAQARCQATATATVE